MPCAVCASGVPKISMLLSSTRYRESSEGEFESQYTLKRENSKISYLFSTASVVFDMEKGYPGRGDTSFCHLETHIVSYAKTSLYLENICFLPRSLFESSNSCISRTL